MLLKTKARTVEMPRAGILGELNILHGAEIDQKQLKKLQESTNQADPVIEVKIKSRTKDRPSDDFKLVVKYEIELKRASKLRQNQIVPQSPMFEE